MVQFPVKYEMIVNLKTAKALGLAVPPSILLRTGGTSPQGRAASPLTAAT